MILEKFFNFLDVNFHHKRIAKFLINYNIETVIDIGSHKGEFLENLSKSISFNNAFTFEPQEEIFKILLQKFPDTNKFHHNNVAVSDTIGKKKINISKLTYTSTLSIENDKSKYLKIKRFLSNDKKQEKYAYDVETVTLDTYFREKNLNNSLLKIDVEGHELNVLEGSKNIIKKIKYVIIERQYFKSYKDNFPEECNKFLTENSFILAKKFRFPTLHAEDRFYINQIYKKN